MTCFARGPGSRRAHEHGLRNGRHARTVAERYGIDALVHELKLPTGIEGREGLSSDRHWTTTGETLGCVSRVFPSGQTVTRGARTRTNVMRTKALLWIPIALVLSLCPSQAREPIPDK